MPHHLVCVEKFTLPYLNTQKRAKKPREIQVKLKAKAPPVEQVYFTRSTGYGNHGCRLGLFRRKQIGLLTLIIHSSALLSLSQR